MARRPKVFRRPRWLVISGPEELVQYASAEAAALIQAHVPYVVQTFAGGCDARRLRRHNLVLVGTPASNELIGALARERKLPPLARAGESYAISVQPSPFNAARQVLVLAGRDAAGALYAVRDWEHYCYDPYAASLAGRAQPLPHAGGASPQPAPFHRPLPQWRMSGSPKVPQRGIWTWGHVVYDYRAFLEHMSRWKLNTLICWNDYAPINARPIAEFAHARGIRVIWGYSWCWGKPVDPNDPGELARWTQRAVRTYEEQYLPLGADGIYFQAFTETQDQRIGRKTIAELAVRWVNHIAGALLERHPGLRILFGVHATSIRANAPALRAVDPRVNVTWEDVGCFPYSYRVNDVTGLPRTVAYTRRVAGLRGRGEDAGFVLKGMPNLDWSTFEHQLGPFVMGRADRDFIRRRAAAAARRWKPIELGWRKNLHAVCRVIQAAVAARPARLTITGLVEDALWEDRMWLPPCLLAEALWNPDEGPQQILAKVAGTRDAHCLA